jgi:hypothetical protein
VADEAVLKQRRPTLPVDQTTGLEEPGSKVMAEAVMALCVFFSISIFLAHAVDAFRAARWSGNCFAGRLRNEWARAPLESAVLSRSCVVSWDSRFAEPIELPGGVRLASLREAIVHLIDTVPSSERGMPVILTAANLIVSAAEQGGAIEFARIATLRAINRHVEYAFDPSRKDTHWGRRKLARDRWLPAVLTSMATREPKQIISAIARSAARWSTCVTWRTFMKKNPPLATGVSLGRKRFAM